MTEPNNQQPAIRVVMMPCDTNPMGTIFGGIILSYIDQAGAVEFRRRSDKRMVTVAMHEVKFLAPVLVGDLVSLLIEYNQRKTKNIGFLGWFGP
jgi:acyl-CoA thioesterase YciA